MLMQLEYSGISDSRLKGKFPRCLSSPSSSCSTLTMQSATFVSKQMMTSSSRVIFTQPSHQASSQ